MFHVHSSRIFASQDRKKRMHIYPFFYLISSRLLGPLFGRCIAVSVFLRCARWFVYLAQSKRSLTSTVNGCFGDENSVPYFLEVANQFPVSGRDLFRLRREMALDKYSVLTWRCTCDWRLESARNQYQPIRHGWNNYFGSIWISLSTL